MGIIKFEKISYWKSDINDLLRFYWGLEIHQLCQNRSDAKDLSYQNMLNIHHIIKKQLKFLSSDVRGTASFGLSAHEL